jgi:LPPG:FO 2-phospho-L-lactate transferase
MRIVLLCGGVGGAKLAQGFAAVLPPQALTIIVNTGDDFEHVGLPIWPDIDTVLYTLAGVAHPEQGWGRQAETWSVMTELVALGGPEWFRLGDKDIALHLLRRQQLDDGVRPTDVVANLSRRLGVRHRILPMADTPVRTMVLTDAGVLAFQDYFVRQRCAPVVTGFRFEGAAGVVLTPEVLAATAPGAVDAVILCPSNPWVSIGPILAVPGLVDRLSQCGAPIVAVSPIISGEALKGPAAKMMRELSYECTALAVARFYGKLLDAFVLDQRDASLLGDRRAEDPELHAAQTIMTGPAERIDLARTLLELVPRFRSA